MMTLSRRGGLLSIAVILIVLIASGCRTDPAPTPPVESGGLITWTRDPAFIVFRADVIGGDDAFAALAEVPLCTIYGDNRIVWMDAFDPRDASLLEDRLSDETISAFVTYLTVNERIYTYSAATERPSGEPAPVVERVEIGVNDARHSADALSGWGRGWFERVVNACQRLSNAPVLIAPNAGWLHTRAESFSPDAPLAFWNPETTGIALGDYASAPGYVSGETAAQLWNRIRVTSSRTLYQEGDRYFRVTMQIPGVTRDAPPAPAAPQEGQ